MNKKIIVTNLRIDKNDWYQIKSIAGELGLSVNEYINYLIRSQSLQRELGIDLSKNEKKAKRLPIWKLGELTEKVKTGKTLDLSPEDKIIYE